MYPDYICCHVTLKLSHLVLIQRLRIDKGTSEVNSRPIRPRYLDPVVVAELYAHLRACNDCELEKLLESDRIKELAVHLRGRTRKIHKEGPESIPKIVQN